MKLTFCGAARSVTGSCYLLETGDAKLLIDCGLFQEREFEGRNWDSFPFDPEAIDAVLLTHAHIDHSGRLPLLAKHGFVGPIWTTPAGVDLTELLLLDAAHIQEEDARFKTKRHRKEGRDKPPTEPLYTTADAQACLSLLRGVKYHAETEVVPGATATWNDAGHILGSGHLRLRVTEDGAERVLVFSGDVGMSPRPILRDPEPFAAAEILVCEATYGDRLHDERELCASQLAEIINQTLHRGGNLVIPAFAVGRTQTILYYLARLMEAKAIPEVTTFVDSPMAIRATEILHRHPECYDDEARALLAAGEDPIGFEPLHFTVSTTASKAINRVRGCIIISASGMCNAGRIKHHLAWNIGRSESTILFCGFQARGTLGRQITDGAAEVRILGQMHPVRARIEQISGMSGHADRDGLLAWLAAYNHSPARVFVTHSESDVADTFAATVRERFGWQVDVPEYLQSIEL